MIALFHRINLIQNLKVTLKPTGNIGTGFCQINQSLEEEICRKIFVC